MAEFRSGHLNFEIECKATEYGTFKLLVGEKNKNKSWNY